MVKRRTRKSAALGLWMNGQRVGTWMLTAQEEHQLHYDESWLASPLGRPLSLSMPLRPTGAPYKGELVRNFFENLLPDNGNIRRSMEKTGLTSGLKSIVSISNRRHRVAVCRMHRR